MARNRKKGFSQLERQSLPLVRWKLAPCRLLPSTDGEGPVRAPLKIRWRTSEFVKKSESVYLCLGRPSRFQISRTSI